MTREIKVYAGIDGTDFRGTYLDKDKEMLKRKYAKDGYIGYLSGYRNAMAFDGTTDGIMSFFKIRPTESEIARRRRNGFKSAKWNWIT